jgi:pimeloyl-ACP methyl ester carboxylesterase
MENINTLPDAWHCHAGNHGGVMKKRTVTLLLFAMTLFSFVSNAAELPGSPPFEFGLYWYGHGAQKVRYDSERASSFFDPSKPTVIFFHGWQLNSTKDGYRKVNLHLKHGDVDVYTHDNWIDRGWNFGLFHWEQWADEKNVQWAEAKIWSTTGPQGMRAGFLQEDGSVIYEELENPDWNRPVSVHAAEQIIEALDGYTGKNIRFVGHSLGNQLATATAKILFDKIASGQIDEDTYKLQRLALLDPAWTKGGKTWWPDDTDLDGNGQSDWVGERCRWAIFDMMDRWTNAHDFVVEIYNTTPLENELFGIAMDANKPLRERIAGTTRVGTRYYPIWDVLNKHIVANRYYFWSMAFEPPQECLVNWKYERVSTGKMGPSAATPEWRIKEMMGRSHFWVQVEGRTSPTPGDDLFELKTTWSDADDEAYDDLQD